MKRIAVVTAQGIGDAMILHVASHNFRQSGWEVTTFNDHIASFGKWLSGYHFSVQPPLDDVEDLFVGKFDAVFLQHDNSQKAKKIASLPMPVHIFYGEYLPSKHGFFRERLDYVCDPGKTMVANIVRAVGKITGACSTENGLKPLPDVSFRRHPKRIAIHPTSTQEERNWPRGSFCLLMEKLKKRGFDPVFTVSPKERAGWNAPYFPNLESLTTFLYESGGFIGNDSGLAHIASYLGLPYLVIGKSYQHMQLWKPGWKPGHVLTPPRWSSYFKLTRENWKIFITVQSVFKSFININDIN